MAGGVFVAPSPNPEHIIRTLEKLGGGHHDFSEMPTKTGAPCHSILTCHRWMGLGQLLKAPTGQVGLGEAKWASEWFSQGLSVESDGRTQSLKHRQNICALSNFFNRQNMLFS